MQWVISIHWWLIGGAITEFGVQVKDSTIGYVFVLWSIQSVRVDIFPSTKKEKKAVKHKVIPHVVWQLQLVTSVDLMGGNSGEMPVFWE